MGRSKHMVESQRRSVNRTKSLDNGFERNARKMQAGVSDDCIIHSLKINKNLEMLVVHNQLAVLL